MTIDDATEKIADDYLSVAYLSISSRTKRGADAYRYESRGLLRTLETILGMDAACRLVEQRHPASTARGMTIDAVLYDFWKLDRP